MALWDSINDKSWILLDWLWDHGIPIGRVFEKYNLPAVLFPLGIILVILITIWLFLPSAAPAGACGDGICASGETCSDCPLDCGECPPPASESFILTVELTGAVSEPITVKIFDKNDIILDSETDRQGLFEFANIQPQVVRAVVSCPNGKEQSSRPRKVTKEDNLITLPVPRGCFDYIMNDEEVPIETHGNIEVSIIDDETGDYIDARVAAIRLSDNLPEADRLTSGGVVTLNVRADNFYYLTASRTGYESYDGTGDRFYVIGGDTIYRAIRLKPIIPDTGRLTVCAFSNSEPLQSGRISVVEVGGLEIASASLTPADNGCITFDIPAGKLVKAALASPPQGCTPSAFSDPVTITGGADRINLDISCDPEQAFVRVIVYDKEGNIKTDQVKITLWDVINGGQIPGTAPDLSLSLGSGGYTEEIAVSAGAMIQAKATGTPLGYVDTVSGPAVFSPGEHGSITIVLGEVARGGFEFLGASIVYTPATPGSPIRVFVQQILYNGTALTEENSEVSVLIEGKEYEALYNESAAI